ncbi:MAG: substrate-binding domain-containing protein [Myxococcota bacterium]
MSEPALFCTVRARRAEAGLSQAALADRVGVSRQALSAIEGGRAAPSTVLALQLARALRCTVDDLFRLPGGPVVHAHVAGEVGSTPRVVLGRVDDRLVAHPVHDDGQAADGAVLVAADGAPAAIELFGDATDLESTALVAGCAPLLGVLAERLGRRYRDARAVRIPSSSGRALALLEAGQVHIAGIHLAPAVDPSEHVRAAQQALPGERSNLVNLARWRQGLVVAPGNPLGVRSVSDLARPDVRHVARDPGAGAQRLLDRLIGEAQVAPAPAVRVAASHDDVAKLVRWGVVDVGVAIESVAMSYGLDFLPLAEERFDLVVAERRLATQAVARLLDLIDQPAFRSEAAGLPGYDLSMAGHASTVLAEAS